MEISLQFWDFIPHVLVFHRNISDVKCNTAWKVPCGQLLLENGTVIMKMVQCHTFCIKKIIFHHLENCNEDLVVKHQSSRHVFISRSCYVRHKSNKNLLPKKIAEQLVGRFKVRNRNNVKLANVKSVIDAVLWTCNP